MGLWCRCGAHWPPRRMTRAEERRCLRWTGGLCSLTDPCVMCLRARARAVERVGRRFPALGAAVQDAVLANA